MWRDLGRLHQPLFKVWPVQVDVLGTASRFQHGDNVLLQGLSFFDLPLAFLAFLLRGR